MFYTRSEDPHNHQLVIVMRSGRRSRFSADKMQQEISRCGLSLEVLRYASDIAYNRAMSFVPAEDEDQIFDSADPQTEPPPNNNSTTVSEQTQRDLDIVQNLLCEFQTELGL